MTELKTEQGNVLATIEWGKGTDAELNIVTSVFGKGNEKGNTLQTAASKPHGGIAFYRDILANVLVQAKDKHPSSLSTDKNDIVWPEPTVGSTASTDNAEVVDSPTEVAEGETVNRGGNSSQPISFVSKDSNNDSKKQEPKAITTNNQGGILDIATAIAKEQDRQDVRDQVNTESSDAQKEAGNYKMGHLKVDGLDVSIENPKGSTRSGKDANGTEWSVTMNNDYGYIRITEGADGDHVDVFLSDNPEQGDVFVVDQVKSDGSFDEHKVMYGFNSEEEARAAYLANYSPGWKGLGAITRTSKEAFKEWVKDGAKKSVPFAGVVDEKSETEKQLGKPKRAFFNLKLVSEEEKKQLADVERRARIDELFKKEKEAFANESGHNSYAEGLRESKTWQEAVSFFRKKKSELEAEAKDWSGRKYKKNGGSVLVRSDEDMDGWEEKSVDGINERRRNNAIRAALKRAQEYEEFAQTLMKRIGVTEADLDKDSNEYKYQMTIRPFSIGTQPDGHLRHEDDGSRYGVVVYDHKLSRQEVDNFSLRPITEAQDLNGKSYEVPFGTKKLEYRVFKVDNNGNIHFKINGQYERTLPYYKFLDEIRKGAKEKSESTVKNERRTSEEFGERVNIEYNVAFPIGINNDSVITKKQKGGKRSVSENISVAMVDGNLYIKRYVKGDARRNVSIRIPNAKQYGANEIVYRLELGVGTSTDAVRLMGDAILELYKKEGMRFEKSVGASAVSPDESVLRDALVGQLRATGIDVVTDSDAGQRMLDAVNGKVRAMAFGEEYDYEKYPSGRVEPGLTDRKVRIEKADLNHGFANFDEARKWARNHIVRTLDKEESGGKGNVKINGTAINKYLSESAVAKSDSKDIHLAVLKVLPKVICESIDVETTPDFKKDENGVRKAGNEIKRMY